MRAITLFNSLSTAYWRADLRGGLQAAAVALPMGLAFGVASGAGPVAGIYSAVFAGLCAAIFGGTPTQISGPTGPTAIVMATVFVQFAQDIAAAFAIVVLAGIMQLIFGALRMGRYINMVPYPVTSGFACAVGAIIITMQINPILGHSGVSDTLEAVWALPNSIANGNPLTFVIAVACAIACRVIPRWARQAIPVHFSVLVAGTIAVNMLGLDVPKIGAPESLLPSFHLPNALNLPWANIWLAALVLALISSLDSLVTAMSADNATQEFHDSDRELFGQGIGNIFCGLFGALPGSGSTFRTMANIRGGGRTPLSGVVHSIVLLGLLLSAGTLIRYIPACVLSGILVYIGLGIIDWAYIRRFPTAPRVGVIVMLSVWIIGLFINVVTAVAIGVFVASLAMVKKMADLQFAAMSLSDQDDHIDLLSEDEQAMFERSLGRTLYIHLGGPLTFGAANGLTKQISVVTEHKVLILDFTAVPHIDESAIVALENVIRRARKNEQTVVLVGLQSAVIREFIRWGLQGLIKSCTRYRRPIDALRFAARISAK